MTTDKRTVILSTPLARRTAHQYIDEAGDGFHVTIRPPTRSLDQNARLWAMLGDISRQVVWYGKRLAPEDWKHVFTASLRKLDVVPNIDGTGFVALGMHTSTMTRREMSDLQTLMEAFGAERDVIWSEPAAQREAVTA